MSGSEADIPSEAALSRALRDDVIATFKSGNEDDLTVKRVRTRTENRLGLPDGFFRREDWKQKSQELIHEAVDKYCGDDPESSSPAKAPTPKKAPPKTIAKTKPEPKKKAKLTEDSASGVKRKPAAPAKKPQKKRRKSTPSDEDEDALSDIATDDQLSEAETKPAKKIIRRQKKVVAEDSGDEEPSPSKARNQTKAGDVSDSEQETSAVQHMDTGRPSPSVVKGDVSDSEMSSLIDESPVKKRQKKTPAEKSRKGKPAVTKTAKTKAAPKTKAEDDPDQAEIKRLQSWLVKCGIRKVWGKELMNCDTSKEKIKHLKGMLKDAGMDGKYSNEKAAQIKEQREFAKDLEEIQAGALAWGESEKTDTGRPRRRATKPAPKPVVPIDDVDEDEDGKAEGEKDATDDDMDDDDDEDVQGESEADDDDDVEMSD